MKNLLVTGAPRTSTTVLGECIAKLADYEYMWEPFNLRFRAGVSHYYPRVTDSTEKSKKTAYRGLIENTLAGRKLRGAVIKDVDDALWEKGLKSLGVSKIKIKYLLNSISLRLRRRPVLVKDPIAIFLTEYLITEFNFKAVFTIRHPCAVVWSRLKLGWKVDFSPWLEQPEFGPCHQIHSIAAGDEAAAAAWHYRIIYEYLTGLAEKYPESVLCVRHEDMCNRPEDTLATCLRFCNGSESAIPGEMLGLFRGAETEKTSGDLSKVEARDANALTKQWRGKLAPQDVDKICRINSALLEKHYPDLG